SAIGSDRSAAPPSDFAVELDTEAHQPILKRLDEILGCQAVHHLCLRQSVSQSLTLGISYDGARLEENGDDVRSRKKQEGVAPYRAPKRRWAPGFEADHDQAKQQLPDTLSFYRISEQQ